ncbi:hypothetical protein V6Z11_D06G118500 [Gossypium hirsutum]
MGEPCLSICNRPKLPGAYLKGQKFKKEILESVQKGPFTNWPKPVTKIIQRPEIQTKPNITSPNQPSPDPITIGWEALALAPTSAATDIPSHVAPLARASYACLRLRTCHIRNLCTQYLQETHKAQQKQTTKRKEAEIVREK